MKFSWFPLSVKHLNFKPIKTGWTTTWANKHAKLESWTKPSYHFGNLWRNHEWDKRKTWTFPISSSFYPYRFVQPKRHHQRGNIFNKTQTKHKIWIRPSWFLYKSNCNQLSESVKKKTIIKSKLKRQKRWLYLQNPSLFLAFLRPAVDMRLGTHHYLIIYSSSKEGSLS